MTLPSDADKLLATLRTGDWLDAQEFPPLTYAVPGLIPEGSVLLVGPPKIGKSWLVLTIALAAASGGKALGLDIPKRRCCTSRWRTATAAYRTAAGGCWAVTPSPR